MFLNKTPPAWAKGLFITIKDLCTVTRLGFITADEFVKSHTPRKHIHNTGNLDYLEILKLIPKDWQNKIKQNTALSEQDTVKVMIFSSKRKWQEKNMEHANGINVKIGNSNISLRKSNGNNFSLVSTRIQKRRKRRNKFLHFAQPYLPCLREIGQNYGSIRMHQV